MGRAQLSLPLLEAGVGVLLVLAVVAALALGSPADAGTDRAQLDTYAADLGTVLATAGDGGPRLATALASADAFADNRSALLARARALAPANVLVRVETPLGAVGHEPPRDRPVGVARVPTVDGVATLWVWYP